MNFFPSESETILAYSLYFPKLKISSLVHIIVNDIYYEFFKTDDCKMD